MYFTEKCKIMLNCCLLTEYLFAYWVRSKTPVWPWNELTNKIHIYSYTKPTHLIFGTVIDIVSIFYHTKNQVGGLCIGGISLLNGSLTKKKFWK